MRDTGVTGVAGVAGVSVLPCHAKQSSMSDSLTGSESQTSGLSDSTLSFPGSGQGGAGQQGGQQGGSEADSERDSVSPQRGQDEVGSTAPHTRNPLVRPRVAGSIISQGHRDID